MASAAGGLRRIGLLCTVEKNFLFLKGTILSFLGLNKQRPCQKGVGPLGVTLAPFRVATSFLRRSVGALIKKHEDKKSTSQ